MEFLIWLLFFIKMIIFTFLSWPQVLVTFICLIIIVHAYYNFSDYWNSDNIFMFAIAHVVNILIITTFLLYRFWNWFKYTYIGNKIYRLLVYLENCYQETKKNILRHMLSRMMTFGGSNIRNIPRYSQDSDDTDED